MVTAVVAEVEFQVAVSAEIVKHATPRRGRRAGGGSGSPPAAPRGALGAAAVDIAASELWVTA